MGTPPQSTYSAPFYHQNNSTPMTPPAGEIKTEDVRYSYPFDPSYGNTWNYPQEYNVAADPTSYYNASSCVDAANIIRTMRSDAGPELESDLGCRVPNQDCYISNNVVFNMMDKYSNPHSAI